MSWAARPVTGGTRPDDQHARLSTRYRVASVENRPGAVLTALVFEVQLQLHAVLDDLAVLDASARFDHLDLADVAHRSRRGRYGVARRIAPRPGAGPDHLADDHHAHSLSLKRPLSAECMRGTQSTNPSSWADEQPVAPLRSACASTGFPHRALIGAPGHGVSVRDVSGARRLASTDRCSSADLDAHACPAT